MVQVHSLAPKTPLYIEEELRLWEGEYHYPAGLLDRGANEINRLRRELYQISQGNLDIEQAVWIARDALRSGDPGGEAAFEVARDGSNPSPVANSAQPCGCDAGAKWVCERHRNECADHEKGCCPFCGTDHSELSPHGEMRGGFGPPSVGPDVPGGGASP